MINNVAYTAVEVDKKQKYVYLWYSTICLNNIISYFADVSKGLIVTLASTISMDGLDYAIYLISAII